MEYTCHYHQKWVDKIGARAITFGRHIFFNDYKSKVSVRIMR
ncbi:hypothetical protein LCGC14_2983260, partial [marine sediment metagenome]